MYGGHLSIMYIYNIYLSIQFNLSVYLSLDNTDNTERIRSVLIFQVYCISVQITKTFIVVSHCSLGYADKNTL